MVKSPLMCGFKGIKSAKKSMIGRVKPPDFFIKSDLCNIPKNKKISKKRKKCFTNLKNAVE